MYINQKVKSIYDGSFLYTPLAAIYPVLFSEDNRFCVSFQRYSMQNICVSIPLNCYFMLFATLPYLTQKHILEIMSYQHIKNSLFLFCMLKSISFYKCVTIHFSGPLLMDIQVFTMFCCYKHSAKETKNMSSPTFWSISKGLIPGKGIYRSK